MPKPNRAAKARMLSVSQATTRRTADAARRTAYRQIVLSSAGSAFARQGVAATKMEQLAQEAGLSLATLYSVFRGKADIVDAIHEQRLREIHASSVAAQALESDPLDTLLAGSRAYISYFLEHPDYLRLYIDEGTTWGVRDSIGHGTRRAEAWNEGVAQFAAIFERGIETGVFVDGDPDQLTRIMLAMQQVQLADWLHSDRSTGSQELIASAEALLRRAFCVSDSAPSSAP